MTGSISIRFLSKQYECRTLTDLIAVWCATVYQLAPDGAAPSSTSSALTPIAALHEPKSSSAFSLSMAVACSGKATFKKNDGILEISPDSGFLIWTPTSAGSLVTIAVGNISNLQQTPDSSSKVMLKVFQKALEVGGESIAAVFSFNSPHARAEANAIKQRLSKLLLDVRANNQVVGSGQMPQLLRRFDDHRLKADIELQQSLMKTDRNVRQTYMEARESKPETITDAAFNAQFWSTRTNLLRAHAIETEQKKGAYNVFSVVRPRTVDGEMKLNITAEQVQLILGQHPLVNRIYNENVPKLSEQKFWSRFFLSRLAKKLRGERVSANDPADALFDRYDERENLVGFKSKILSHQVPHMIDVEANEENQGGYRSGNRKDIEMRPRNDVPVIRTLNSISEKIMADVAPTDADPAQADAVDRAAFDELALRDLQGKEEESRIILNIKEQNLFFSNREPVAPSTNASHISHDHVLSTIATNLACLQSDPTSGLDLHSALGFDDASDSEYDTPRQPHVGSRASLKSAEKAVMAGIARRRWELYGPGSDRANLGLSPELSEQCTITRATTVEFLHQFWNAFLSGNPDRAVELQYLVQSLDKSAERIKAVAEAAEKERQDTMAQKKKEIRKHYEKTGKKIWPKLGSVGGGRDAVLMMMQPILDTLDCAQGDYQRALAEEGVVPLAET